MSKVYWWYNIVCIRHDMKQIKTNNLIINLSAETIKRNEYVASSQQKKLISHSRKVKYSIKIKEYF